MKAYELLNSPEKVCRDAVARDANGKVVGARDDRAVMWCGIGAMSRCGTDDDNDMLWRAAQDAGFFGVVDLFRRGTFEQIQAVLRKADV